MNGIIKDGKAYCPFCKKHDYRITGYRQIEKATEITATCRACNREFEYLLNIKAASDNVRFGGEIND